VHLKSEIVLVLYSSSVAANYSVSSYFQMAVAYLLLFDEKINNRYLEVKIILGPEEL
jgi:hypothetical protein